MAKRRKDRIREERIHDEAIVDAYGPEDRAMGWYYYLENKIHFPFQAKCIGLKPTSPLRKGETVEVRRLASDDICTNDMLVLIDGRAAIWPFHSPNWTPLIRTIQRMTQSATGTTGSRRATSFKNPPPQYSCAALPKEHDLISNASRSQASMFPRQRTISSVA